MWHVSSILSHILFIFLFRFHRAFFLSFLFSDILLSLAPHTFLPSSLPPSFLSFVHFFLVRDKLICVCLSIYSRFYSHHHLLINPNPSLHFCCVCIQSNFRIVISHTPRPLPTPRTLPRLLLPFLFQPQWQRDWRPRGDRPRQGSGG